MLSFDYPLTRPYPWRFATPLILLGSMLIGAILVLINLMTAGLMTYATYAPDFQPRRSMPWAERWNMRSLANYRLGCEPTSLQTGGMEKTTNGAYTYTIQSLFDRATSSPTSNVNYSNSDLGDCMVAAVTLKTSYITYETQAETTINCTISGGIELMASTSISIIKPDMEEQRAHATPVAENIGNIVGLFTADYYFDVVLGSYSWHKDDPLAGSYLSFRIGTDASITWDVIKLTAPKKALGPNQTQVPDYLSPSGVQAIENYLHVISSAILSDLGVVSPQNLLIDTDTLRSMIKPLNWTWYKPPSTPSVNDLLQSGLADYTRPFSSLQPTHFTANYSCYYLSWKPVPSLVVDVLVATISMFMVYWRVLASVLKFFAERQSKKVRERRFGVHAVQPSVKIGSAAHTRATRAKEDLLNMV